LIDVQGAVEPGFEAVRAAFAEQDLGRGGGAFAAYVDGVPVVDLWAGHAEPGKPWERDTRTTGMSATKGLASVCCLVLHARGLLDVEAPVARYWPEFGQAGKESTLVRHVLNHTSGVVGLQDPGSVLAWDGTGWDDYDGIAAQIAVTSPAWVPGTKIGYHAISVGWLQQELVRRITGLTIGEFLDKEIAQPLGLSMRIGTPEDEQVGLAPVIADRPDAADNPALAHLLQRFHELMHDPDLPLAQSAVLMHGRSIFDDPDFWNRPKVRAVQIPAANGTFDARSLARLYAVLAQGGELDGVQLATPESVRLFGTKTFSGPSGLWEGITPPDEIGSSGLRYALGFEGDFGETPLPWRFGPNPRTFGHLGAGGQIGFADTDRRVAVGFVRNHHAEWAVSTALVDALYGCLDLS
jgi:CubicO group peptidase (beta-lactamase class C family)